MDPGVSFVPAEFWGVKVAAKKSVTVGKTFSAEEDELDTYHLSQVALGPNADAGRHVVFIEYEGQKNVIGSLALGKTEQFQIDFPVNCELTVSHSGKSDVYVTGYTTRQYLSLGSSSDDEGQWVSASDEEPLPLAGKQLPNGRPSAAKQMRTLQRMAEDTSSEDDGDGSEEESEEEESEDDGGGAAGNGSAAARQVRAQAHQFSDMDDDSEGDESDEEDEDSEDDDEPAAAAAGARAALGKLFADQADEDDDEDSDLEEDEDEEDDEEEEESDEDLGLKPAPKVGAKRGAAPDATPQQQKKAKAAAVTPGSPGGTAKYQADLVQYLKANGATKLAVLGSQVKRAPGLPKMKKFLEDRSAVFQLDAQAGLASLA